MRYPKDIEVWENAPGRKIAEVVIRMKNSKGALARCSQAIADLGVNILTGTINSPSGLSVATLSFFVDVTDMEGGVSELRSAIGGLDSVEFVKVVPAGDGFLVDREHFPVQWAGRRAIVLRTGALNQMLDRLWVVFGTGAATIIDQMAEAMGQQLAKEVMEDLGPKFVAENLDEILGAYSALGFCDVSIERSKSSDFPLVVNAKELFECQYTSKRRMPRRSSFFRAHLRGFMTATFAKPFEVTEVQCLTEGDDLCSFRVAPEAVLSEGMAARVPERAQKEAAESNI
jgi:predicted hydrocarbon binding protein